MKPTEKEIESLFFLKGNYDLIKCTKNVEFYTVFDVGCGRGGASLYFASQGKKVTAITLGEACHSYNCDWFDEFGIDVCFGDFLEFQTDKKFDAVWMSHSLEHTQNVGLFLQKAKSILNDDGWLFVLVPPHSPSIVDGHFTIGWNVGLLMYNLLAAGFDIKNGHFIKYGTNICAFVRKKQEEQNPYVLITESVEQWPIKVHQRFCGDIDQINWFNDFLPELEKEKALLAKYNQDDKKIFDFYINNILDSEETKNKIADFVKTHTRAKILFYGAGDLAEKLLEKYDFNNLEILGFVDQNPKKVGQKLKGHVVYDISNVKKLLPDVIIVTTLRKVNIIDSLKRLAVKDNLSFAIETDLF